MKILAISAHPDDETLGCGGMLLRHRAAGDQIYWLIATQAFEPKWSSEIIEKKADEVKAVATAYGMQDVYKLGFATTQLDQVPQSELIASIGQVADQVHPAVVYLVHDGDVHTDHHAVFTATFSVFKAFYMLKWGVQRILSYETLSSTEAAPPQAHRLFIPNVYNDITPYLEQKIAIMQLYESEIQSGSLPRTPSSIKALARYRGATVGVEYAEAFTLNREVS